MGRSFLIAEKTIHEITRNVTKENVTKEVARRKKSNGIRNASRNFFVSVRVISWTAFSAS